MLTKYIDAAMRKAHYELIEDGTYWGEIPGFQGVWGNAPTLEECRDELQSVLEEWLLWKIRDGDDDIPVLGKLSLLPAAKKALASIGTAGPSRDHQAASAPDDMTAPTLKALISSCSVENTRFMCPTRMVR